MAKRLLPIIMIAVILLSCGEDEAIWEKPSLENLTYGDGYAELVLYSWSWDGEKLYYGGVCGDQYPLYDVALRRGIYDQYPEEIYPGGFSFSMFHFTTPDEKWVLYAAREGGNPWACIYKSPLDDLSQVTRLTPLDTLDNMPKPSPDGQWLAFLSMRYGTGIQEIYILSSNGDYQPESEDNPAIQLTYTGNFLWGYAWSSYSQWIAYALYDEDSHFSKIYKVNIYSVDKPVEIPCDENLRYIHILDWSSDANWLIMSWWDDEAGRNTVGYIPADGGLATPFLDPKEYLLEDTAILSPQVDRVALILENPEHEGFADMYDIFLYPFEPED